MKKEIAKHLLEIEAVTLRPNEPFTWASGIKSPIYCDNRLTLSYPKLRKIIYKGLVQLISEHFSDAELIAGTATAGIPHAALVAEELGLPMCYVRSTPKKHGKGNQIEGKVREGQKAVVIEDLISTGASSLKAVEALRNAGCQVLGVAAIFTYGLPQGKQNFANAGIPAIALSDYDTLIQVALDVQMISKEDLDRLSLWRKNPENDSWLEKV